MLGKGAEITLRKGASLKHFVAIVCNVNVLTSDRREGRDEWRNTCACHSCCCVFTMRTAQERRGPQFDVFRISTSSEISYHMNRPTSFSRAHYASALVMNQRTHRVVKMGLLPDVRAIGTSAALRHCDEAICAPRRAAISDN